MAIIPGDIGLSGFGADQVNFNVPGAQFARVFRTFAGSDKGIDILGVECYMFGASIPAASFGVLYTTVGIFRTGQTIAADDCPIVLAGPAGGAAVYPAGVDLLWIAETSQKHENPTAGAVGVRGSTLGSKVSWRFPPGCFRCGPNQRFFVFAMQPGLFTTAGPSTPQCAVQFSVMGIDYNLTSEERIRGVRSLPRFDMDVDA